MNQCKNNTNLIRSVELTQPDNSVRKFINLLISDHRAKKEHQHAAIQKIPWMLEGV